MALAGIEFQKVTKRYGSVIALDRFDLTVEPGEFMTFLGPSGSGKTTALNILAGFASASEGDVRIGGRSVVNLPPEQRNVGMVFQSYSLFPHLSVFENVAFPLRLRGMRGQELTAKVNGALEMVQLADYGSRMPTALSGGQRQRVAFARAVVFEPPVLLMDEPLGALDLKLREQMQLEIKRFHRQLGCTIIFVTHDQNEALTLSDRVAIMRDGRIAQVDSATHIYDRPASRYVAEFIGQTNFFELADQGGRWSINDLGAEIVPLDNKPGQGRALSVRPEKIAPVADISEPGIVSFAARITNVVFQGDHVAYEAITDNSRSLNFQEHRGQGVELKSAGDDLRLGFRERDAVPVA